MPKYSMRNTETGEEFDIYLSLSEREAYLGENKHIVQILSAPTYAGDNVRLTGPKANEGFKDVLRNIKSHHKRSTINV